MCISLSRALAHCCGAEPAFRAQAMIFLEADGSGCWCQGIMRETELGLV